MENPTSYEYEKAENVQVNDVILMKFEIDADFDGTGNIKRVLFWPSKVTKVSNELNGCQVVTIGMGEQFAASLCDMHKLDYRKPPPSWYKDDSFEDFWSFSECLAFKAYMKNLGFGNSLAAEVEIVNNFADSVDSLNKRDILKQFHQTNMKVGAPVYFGCKNFPFWPAIIKKIKKISNDYELQLQCCGTGEIVETQTKDGIIPFCISVRQAFQEVNLQTEMFMSIQAFWLCMHLEKKLNLRKTYVVSPIEIFNAYGEKNAVRRFSGKYYEKDTGDDSCSR